MTPTVAALEVARARRPRRGRRAITAASGRWTIGADADQVEAALAGERRGRGCRGSRTRPGRPRAASARRSRPTGSRTSSVDARVLVVAVGERRVDAGGRRSAGSRAPGSPPPRRPVQHRPRRSRRAPARRGRPPAARRPFSSRASLAGADSLAHVLDHAHTTSIRSPTSCSPSSRSRRGAATSTSSTRGSASVILDRFLSSSMVYPTDYGYLIGHRGRDGDPLDAMVCVSEPTFPGCVIPVKPIALFKMQRREGRGRQDRLRPDPRPGLEPRRDARGHPGSSCSARSPTSSPSTSSSRARRSRSTAGARARRRSR